MPLFRLNPSATDAPALTLANTDEVMQLGARLDGVNLIVLDFPKFTDGRAYSQARLLRERLGYRGELRATGAVFLDQLPFMLPLRVRFIRERPEGLRRSAGQGANPVQRRLSAGRRWTRHRGRAEVEASQCHSVGGRLIGDWASSQSRALATDEKSFTGRSPWPTVI